MIILDVEQRSPEWFEAKCGVFTASDFSSLVQMDGSPSKQRKKYIYQVAGERITKKKEDSYQNSAMLRGIELEAEAISAYEFLTDSVVNKIGFCYKDEKKLIGCSPDGLIGDNGGLEIKCPSMAVHVGYLLDNKLPSEYFCQVQGCLYVTGRDWWDFMSYYPGLKPLIVRAFPDSSFFSKLGYELNIACKDAEDVFKKIKK